MPPVPHARLSASEFVAETLRREILRGDLLPGQPLLQENIASRFEVSQSSVREALRRLEAQSLVESFRNRGTFVSKITAEQLAEMYDIREAVELLALRSNFDALTTADLDRAEAILHGSEEHHELTLFGEANKGFHAVFYESAERKLTRDILQTILGNLTRIWVDFAKKRPALARRSDEQSRREHREILDAARRRDLPAAERALTNHIRRGRDTLLEYLRNVEPVRPQPAVRSGRG